MLPVIEKFMAAEQLPGVTVVTVVAHAGLISGATGGPVEAVGRRSSS